MQIKHVCMAATVCIGSMLVDVIMAGDIEKKLAAVSSKLEQDFERARLQYAMAKGVLNDLGIKTLKFPGRDTLRVRMTGDIEQKLAAASSRLEKDFERAHFQHGMAKIVLNHLRTRTLTFPEHEELHKQCTDAVAAHKLPRGFNPCARQILAMTIAKVFAGKHFEHGIEFNEAIGSLELEDIVINGLLESSGKSPSKEAVNNGVAEVRNLIASLAREYPPTPERPLQRRWSWSQGEFLSGHDAHPAAKLARVKRSISQ